MKKIIFVFSLLVVSISLFGCGSEAPTQSRFKTNFSLDSVIEANQEYLLEETRISSGAEVGLREPFIQNHEEMMIQIDPSNVSVFMQAIRLEIGRSLADNDASILGHEINGDKNVGYFSYSYSENDLYGTITLWGVRGEGTNFYLITIITES